MAVAPLTVVRRRDRAADYSRLAGDCPGLATGLGDAATPPCVELTPSGRPTTVTRRPGSSNRLATRLASAVSPALSGALLSTSFAALPLVICGVLKIAYDVSLLYCFRHIKPPEEMAPPE